MDNRRKLSIRKLTILAVILAGGVALILSDRKAKEPIVSPSAQPESVSPLSIQKAAPPPTNPAPQPGVQPTVGTAGSAASE